jgi:tetratricopeptide (TPR) repeat protein
LNNIGLVKDGQGEYNDALDYYTKALKIYLNFYNSNHPSIKLIQYNINICHQSSKNDSASNK